MSRRRRFTERQVIETLIRQGAEIYSYRGKVRITLENVGRLEREHILELALGGKNEPANCAYSLKEEHAVVTNGTKATSAGSSNNRIAKDKRRRKGGKRGKGPKIKSRGFNKTLSKHFDGSVTVRVLNPSRLQRDRRHGLALWKEASQHP